MTPKPLDILYIEESDALEIEGVKYAGELFRVIGGAFGEGVCVKIVRQQDGTVTCKKIQEAV